MAGRLTIRFGSLEPIGRTLTRHSRLQDARATGATGKA
jgi:hypothetical protein